MNKPKMLKAKIWYLIFFVIEIIEKGQKKLQICLSRQRFQAWPPQIWWHWPTYSFQLGGMVLTESEVSGNITFEKNTKWLKAGAGVGITKPTSPFRYFPNFSTSPKYMLAIILNTTFIFD